MRAVHWDATISPDLLFAQACDFPLMGAWGDRLQYLATPRFAAPGCEGSRYCSVIVVAADSEVQCLEDLRGACCSLNSRISHSGFNALRAHVAPLARDGSFFGAVRLSGGHAESVDEIVCGKADVTAIDCVSYELFRRVRPAAVAATRFVGRTPHAPGLPYVTRIDVDLATRDRLVAALRRAFTDPALASVRAQLLIEGFDVLPPGSYGCMLDMAGDAKRRGYDELDG